jgi:uncharacterized YccA/Bax inhibitor family protein
MAAFKTSNPTLTEKIFDKSIHENAEAFGVMSIRGTMNKFGFLLLLLIASSSYSWSLITTETMGTAKIIMIGGAIGAFVLAMVMMFKPMWAGYIAPAYAILEGLFIGGISAFFNNMFASEFGDTSGKGSHLIINAVGLTLGVALAMFLLYNFRIINVTNRLRSIIMSATMGVALFYLITWILGMFGVDMGFAFDNSLLSIGISIFIVGLAAFNLLLDFDTIEKGAEMGAPKFMEWYCAFGLLVTLVWLYLEILKLLSKLSSRD